MIYKPSRRGLGFVPRSRNELLRELTALIFWNFCIKAKVPETSCLKQYPDIGEQNNRYQINGVLMRKS